MNQTGIEIAMHVPAVWLKPWRQVMPHPARHQFLDHQEALPIAIRFETPQGLLALKPTEQLRVIGGAALETIEHDLIERPDGSGRRYHQWLLGDRLMESTGTTISVTSYDHGDTAVIAATWDYGEDVSAAIARLATARRIGKFLPDVACTLYERPTRAGQLPPPQAIVSNIIPIGIERGDTVLTAYDNQATSTPIVMAVMRRETHIVFDHRIYNPPDEQAFAEAFLTNLERLAGKWNRNSRKKARKS